MTDFWTIERIDILRQRKAEGKSSGFIAREIGATRNAVIGKWIRIRAREGYIPKPKLRNMDAPKPKARPRLAASAGILLPAVAPPPRGPAVGILDVTGCKWAIGEDASLPGGHAFCNHHKAENSPYCAYHKRKAIAPYSLELRKKTLGPLGLRFGKAAA